MAVVSFMAPCSTHVAHVNSYEVNCWGEATGMVLAIFTEAAVIDEIPALASAWLMRTGTESFQMDFTPEVGETVSIVYSV